MSELIRQLESRFGQKVKLEHSNVTPRKKVTLRRRDVIHLAPVEVRTLHPLPNDRELLTPTIKFRLKHRFRRDIELWKRSLKRS